MTTNIEIVYRALVQKTIIVILMLSPIFTMAQGGLSCRDFKDGKFYAYPKNSQDRYLTEREGNYQNETNLSTGDTIIFKITWNKECSYTLKYMSGGRKLPKEAIALLKEHEVFCEIAAVTADYYTYTAYFDKKSTIPIVKDTMWLHEKLMVKSNELFIPYKSRVIPKKDHFSDTSQYAILYLYRPQKIANSFSNFIVYFDENLMWAAQKNSGCMFKILKEGRYRIMSRLMKNEAFVDVDFKFGKTYYVKSTMKWGFYKGRNFNLEMEQVPIEKGENEFSEVDFK